MYILTVYLPLENAKKNTNQDHRHFDVSGAMYTQDYYVWV